MLDCDRVGSEFELQSLFSVHFGTNTLGKGLTVIICCGLQIRPVEEQLKQRVIGKRYCISRKKEVIQKKY